MPALRGSCGAAAHALTRPAATSVLVDDAFPPASISRFRRPGDDVTRLEHRGRGRTRGAQASTKSTTVTTSKAKKLGREAVPFPQRQTGSILSAFFRRDQCALKPVGSPNVVGGKTAANILGIVSNPAQRCADHRRRGDSKGAAALRPLWSRRRRMHRKRERTSTTRVDKADQRAP